MTVSEVEESGTAGPEKPENAEKPEKPEEPAAPRPPEPDPWDGAAELRDIRKVYVQNNFHGGVHAEHGVFGAGGGEPMSATATGPIPPERVAESLRGFVPPAALDAARTVLRRHRFVVLVGPDGVGKRALGLHLLRLVCGPSAPLVAASPAKSFGQLAAMELVAGTGYLVADHLGAGEEPAVRTYEADRLASLCVNRDTHIVLTTTSKRLGERFLAPYAVAVGPPDPVDTLHSHLGDAEIEPDVLATAAEHVGGSRQPREVALLAKRMIADPARAVQAMRDVPGEHVAEWFDKQVTMRELLSVTALALGGSQPEPTHDLLLDTLRAHAEAVREDREAAPHVPWHEEVPRQRDRDHPLVTVATGDELDDEDGWLSGRRVRFRHEAYRERVLFELHERYGNELWAPVRNWLNDLCRTDLGIELQSELARALAVLARLNFVEIREQYLSSWAAGDARERVTAAGVLWFMCHDDRLAPVALRTALEWGQDMGLRRAVTSALALGGPLGIRFPDEAMQRLCFLSLRAKRIGVVAREAMGALFAVAAADGGEATGRVLATVRAELARATGRRGGDPTADSYVTAQLDTGTDADDPDREQYERGWTGRVATAARSMVLALLCADDGGRPVAAKILRTQPEHVGRLGELWAEVLCSAPHRRAAIDALRDTLRSLENEKQPAIAAVGRLGAAIHAAMPAPHRPLRTTELVRAMTGDRDDPPSELLVSTLLTAFTTDRPARS